MVPKQAWERLYVFMVRDRYEGQMSGGGECPTYAQQTLSGGHAAAERAAAVQLLQWHRHRITVDRAVVRYIRRRTIEIQLANASIVFSECATSPPNVACQRKPRGVKCVNSCAVVYR